MYIMRTCGMQLGQPVAVGGQQPVVGDEPNGRCNPPLGRRNRPDGRWRLLNGS